MAAESKPVRLITSGILRPTYVCLIPRYMYSTLRHSHSVLAHETVLLLRLTELDAL